MNNPFINNVIIRTITVTTSSKDFIVEKWSLSFRHLDKKIVCVLISLCRKFKLLV
jgi:hypothetical protein